MKPIVDVSATSGDLPPELSNELSKGVVCIWATFTHADVIQRWYKKSDGELVIGQFQENDGLSRLLILSVVDHENL